MWTEALMANTDHGTEREESPPEGAAIGRTRRSFLASAGKKAAFVMPVVWSLTAEPAMAVSGGTCSPGGNACAVDADCCSLNCNGGTMTCMA